MLLTCESREEGRKRKCGGTQRAHNIGDVIVSSPLAPFCGLYFSESKVATPAHLQRTAFDSMLALMANDDHGVYSAYDPPTKRKKERS